MTYVSRPSTISFFGVANAAPYSRAFRRASMGPFETDQTPMAQRRRGERNCRKSRVPLNEALFFIEHVEIARL